MSSQLSPNSPRLPIELVIQIINHAPTSSSSNCKERYAKLRTCSLVCKQWRAIVRDELGRHLYAKQDAAGEWVAKLAHWLNDEKMARVESLTVEGLNQRRSRVAFGEGVTGLLLFGAPRLRQLWLSHVEINLKQIAECTPS